MESKLRRSDRAISEAAARAILEKGDHGVLSTVSAEGQPYGVPVNYACTGEVIYFHCAPQGHKLDNLRGNNRVSFCVVGPTEIIPEEYATRYESVIVFGQAFETTGEEKRQGLLALIQKYAPAYSDRGPQHIVDDKGKTRLYKIVMEAISGKARR
jgi:uncharacterized protein